MNDHLNITTDIYNDLNPTYPKQKALIELDTRLNHVMWNVCVCVCVFTSSILTLFYHRKYRQENYM
jgi:hypothetical protein